MSFDFEAVIFMKFGKLVVVNALVLLGLIAVIEAVAQIVILMRPSYEVLFLQPDRSLGWKHVPNHKFTWAGHYWYAADFSVPIEINSIGFRDTERSAMKPIGVRRVALLGDSFIEAIQVPIDMTAARLTQDNLNENQGRGPFNGVNWEVLNFGTSNYGVGQYLLAWEEYASRFSPNYVAVFVAQFHFERTLSKYESGAFKETRNEKLWVRPTFRLDNNELVREPARDFDAFLSAQKELIERAFSGERSRIRREIVVASLAKEFIRRIQVWSAANSRDETVHPSGVPQVSVKSSYVLEEINQRLLLKLHEGVKENGGRLVILDASQYFGNDSSVSDAIESFAVQSGIDYLPVYRDLLTAEANGRTTRWRHDGHLNRLGNEILADSIAAWIRLEDAEDLR